MLDYRVFTFLTLYKEMNYRRTAALLNMTQPGVTQHIQYLEKRYGVKFFTYEGRRLQRTREAEIFKRHLDSIITEERAMREELSCSGRLLLNVGATKTIGEFVLADTVRKFLSCPDHSLNYFTDNTGRLLEMLDDGELDFAVIEGIVDKNRYGCRLFRKESFLGICGKGHPFAGKEVSLEALFKETLLLREKGSGTRDLLEQAIRSRGYSLENFRRTASLSNFSVIMDLLEQNDCVTFAYAPIYQHRESLRSFRVRGMEIEGEFNFVYCNKAIAEEKISQFFMEDRPSG